MQNYNDPTIKNPTNQNYLYSIYVCMYVSKLILIN